MATLFPDLAKRWLIAWPMPEAPPVTTATLLMVVLFSLEGLAASLGWREGDVQIAQPAHDEGGVVVKMPLPRGSVIEMSRVRSRKRPSVTRPSARARGPPGQECAPRPKAMCSRTLSRPNRH